MKRIDFKTGEELLEAIEKLPDDTKFIAYFNIPTKGNYYLEVEK